MGPFLAPFLSSYLYYYSTRCWRVKNSFCIFFSFSQKYRKRRGRRKDLFVLTNMKVLSLSPASETYHAIVILYQNWQSEINRMNHSIAYLQRRPADFPSQYSPHWRNSLPFFLSFPSIKISCSGLNKFSIGGLCIPCISPLHLFLSRVKHIYSLAKSQSIAGSPFTRWSHLAKHYLWPPKMSFIWLATDLF